MMVLVILQNQSNQEEMQAGPPALVDHPSLSRHFNHMSFVGKLGIFWPPKSTLFSEHGRNLERAGGSLISFFLRERLPLASFR